MPSVFVCVLTRVFSRVAFLPSSMFVTTSWFQPPLQHAPFTPAPAHLSPASIPISPRNSLPSLACFFDAAVHASFHWVRPTSLIVPSERIGPVLCYPFPPSRLPCALRPRNQPLNVPLTGDSASPPPLICLLLYLGPVALGITSWQVTSNCPAQLPCFWQVPFLRLKTRLEPTGLNNWLSMRIPQVDSEWQHSTIYTPYLMVVFTTAALRQPCTTTKFACC